MSRQLALTAALLLAACDDHQETTGVDEYIIDCNLPVDAGVVAASDETYRKMIEAEAAGRLMSDMNQAPRLVAPQGSTLDRMTPPTFTFCPTAAACSLPAPAATLAIACRVPPLKRPSGWQRLTRALALEGTAYAHCGAVTGTNYLFRLMRDGDSRAAYTAMLSVTSFTPDAAKWRAAMSSRAGQTLKLTIVRAFFNRGDIMEGPFVQQQPYTFTVQ